ncbi:MAG: glutamate 5-kinase, partial [Candidatus Omnitrophica bacterium]|nr:glutamate 5-kinase [Candidatus Omnitrophota bacterium]
MQQSARSYKRIVIKIGSSLFCADKEKSSCLRFEEVARQVSSLISSGKEIIIVSSGAIAMGMELLALEARPKELPYLQAAAAIGQNALMDNYSRAFGGHKINCAQLLLTWDDFDNRKRYLNAKNTLEALLKLKSVPVINENDTVSTEEIKFGDNDRLSALVASLISADLLVILSDVEGLLDKNKKVIRIIDEIG